MKFHLMLPPTATHGTTFAEHYKRSSCSLCSVDSLTDNGREKNIQHGHRQSSTSEESRVSRRARRRALQNQAQQQKDFGPKIPKLPAQSEWTVNPLSALDPKKTRSFSGWTTPSSAVCVQLQTPSAEKKKVFRNTLTVILSCIYAVFLITVGVVIGVATFLLPDSSIDEVFGIYLTVTGLAWFIFFHFDLLLYSGRTREKLLQRDTDGSHYEKGFSVYNHDIHVSERTGDLSYMFSMSRHSGSFFLKIGSVGFCFVHLIHSALLLTRKIMQLTSDNPEIRMHCGDPLGVVLATLYPIYSFYQLFILFKYSSVIINRCKELARFATMHCLATSLFFWLYMILIETSHSLHHHSSKDHHHNVDAVYEDDSAAAANDLLPSLIDFASDSGELPSSLVQIMNQSLSHAASDLCDAGSDIATIILEFSPYLYPFSIEYSILVVGIWFIIWSNIGKIEEDHEDLSCLPQTGTTHIEHPENRLSNRLVIHADCHAANRGLFAGLLVLVGVIVVIFIIFIGSADNGFVPTAILISSTTELILLVLMTIAVLGAYRQMTLLDINPNPVSLLDDFLLFICIPLFFLYGIFCIVPAMATRNYLAIVQILLQVSQVILQTPFIIDGLRRCSNTATLRARKPGRELVTFLIVANIAMWVLNTFEIKSHDTHQERMRFYGQPLWTFLSHVTLPLTLFYRFHSSVCLVDVWKSAYEPGGH